jgi:hypothetical protein
VPSGSTPRARPLSRGSARSFPVCCCDGRPGAGEGATGSSHRRKLRGQPCVLHAITLSACCCPHTKTEGNNAISVYKVPVECLSTNKGQRDFFALLV